MKNWIREKAQQESENLKSVEWRGILIGFVLSVAVAPVLAGYVTPVYATLGLYDEPQFQTSVEQVDSPYTPGAIAGKYGNLTWESGFEVYRVQFRHIDGPPADRAVFEVRFPGCVRESDGTGYGNGDITVTNPLDAEIYTTNRTDADVLGCTIQISTESINNEEGYQLEFVVDHSPNRCDLLTAYNPNRKYFVDYQWSKNGITLDGRITGDVEGAAEQYENTTLPANSTRLTQKEDYSAYVYGFGNGDQQKALNSCFR